MRSKLLTLIKNREASGQGNGGMDRDHNEDGRDDEQQQDLDENGEILMNREQQ
jgi:hypothetical protein